VLTLSPTALLPDFFLHAFNFRVCASGAPAPRENLKAMRRFNGICTGTPIGAAFQGFDRRTVGDVPGVAGLGVDRRNGCGGLVKEGN
jgi:hypothetical protein